MKTKNYKKITFYSNPQLNEDLEKCSKFIGISKSVILRKILTEYLKTQVY